MSDVGGEGRSGSESDMRSESTYVSLGWICSSWNEATSRNYAADNDNGSFLTISASIYTLFSPKATRIHTHGRVSYYSLHGFSFPLPTVKIYRRDPLIKIQSGSPALLWRLLEQAKWKCSPYALRAPMCFFPHKVKRGGKLWGNHWWWGYWNERERHTESCTVAYAQRRSCYSRSFNESETFFLFLREEWTRIVHLEIWIHARTRG